MIILSASQLSASFGDRTLFSGVSFDVQESDKIGLIGVNGCGKTTLLRMICARHEIENGNIHKQKSLKLGYMEQHAPAKEGVSAYEAVLSLFSGLVDIEHALSDVAQEISDADAQRVDALVAKQHALQERYEREGGYTFRSRARAALLGLGLSEAMLDQPVSTLSGGERAKAMLARLLLSAPDIMLLDEPTNHLDIRGAQWLEEFIVNYPGAALIVSHDRYFLDRVTSRTFELENGKLTAYSGNYSAFYKQKLENRAIATRHYENTRREIARIEAIIAQQRRWNRERNIRMAESKQKQVERIERTLVAPESDPDEIRFRFEPSAVSGTDIIIAEGLSKSFKSAPLFDGAGLHIRNGERVFLLGPNGCGKTTLMKMLIGVLPYDTGYVTIGTNVIAGYYDQTLADLREDSTPLNEVWSAAPAFSQTQARNALAAFLFKGDDVFKPISSLSGGEKARVALCKLMLSGANFLLLDEPTNHLDIASREALERALDDFSGTLLIVSHDRYFINKMSERILALSANGITNTFGNYEDYIETLRSSEPAAAQAPSSESDAARQYKREKQRRSDYNKLVGRRDRAEIAVEEAEARVKSIEAELCENASDYQKSLDLGAALQEAREQCDELYAQWEALQGEIDAWDND